jgi:hypothetical protein
MIRTLTYLAAIPMFAVLCMVAVARAEDRWHGDIRNFHEHDYDHWRGGHWYHGGHGGRRGWWWVVGPDWYFYPAPVYPYPDPFQPPVVVVPPPPSVAAPAYWYYCPNPAGYYPYVPQCRAHWQRVAPQAAPPPPGAVPAPPGVPPPNG